MSSVVVPAVPLYAALKDGTYSWRREERSTPELQTVPFRHDMHLIANVGTGKSRSILLWTAVYAAVQAGRESVHRIGDGLVVIDDAIVTAVLRVREWHSGAPHRDQRDAPPASPEPPRSCEARPRLQWAGDARWAAVSAVTAVLALIASVIVPFI